MESQLALSVINTDPHYEERKVNFIVMSSTDYAAYIMTLVRAEAHDQRRKFGVNFGSLAIDTAVSEVVEHMRLHMNDEWESEEKLAAGVRAIIYLQSMQGIVETPAQAKLGWTKMAEEERDRTMAVYTHFHGVAA